MPTVELNEQDWQQVMAVLGDAPWKIAHPLLMKIGGQLQRQAAPIPAGAGPPQPGIRLDANGKEVRNE